MAIQTMTHLPKDNIAIISLWLTFGGTPGPYEWGVISKAICDLANALVEDDAWNPLEINAPSMVPP